MTRLLINAAWLLVFALSPFTGLMAADGNELFRVAVPVSSQSAAERARAASEGLRQVMVRLSGQPEVGDEGALQPAYDKAQSYIEQFHYAAYRPSGDEAGDDTATEQLVMTFSEPVIERLLREAGQPYWPPNRPPVFVWLVEDTADQGRVLVNEREAPVFQGLAEAARRRGLELRLPLLDLEDRLALSPADLWRFNEEAILAASDRYEVDTLLVGRYSRTSSGRWLSTWAFFHRGTQREFDLYGESAAELGQQALGPLADYLAGQYAISAQAEGRPQLLVQLSGIRSFGDYRQALDYLRDLAVVSDLKLQAVRGDTLLLSLRTEGGTRMLRNALALDRRLQAVESADAEMPPWLQQQEGTPERPVELVWRGR